MFHTNMDLVLPFLKYYNCNYILNSYNPYFNNENKFNSQIVNNNSQIMNNNYKNKNNNYKIINKKYNLKIKNKKKKISQNIKLSDSNKVCYDWAKNNICNNKECKLNHGDKYNFRKIDCKYGNKCILNGKLPNALGVNMCCFKHENNLNNNISNNITTDHNIIIDHDITIKHDIIIEHDIIIKHDINNEEYKINNNNNNIIITWGITGRLDAWD